MSDVFKREWILPYKPTLWMRLKLCLFGKTYISRDLPVEGDFSFKTTIKWKILGGKIYILEISDAE